MRNGSTYTEIRTFPRVLFESVCNTSRPTPFDLCYGPSHARQIPLGCGFGRHGRTEEDDVEASQHRPDAFDRKSDAADTLLHSPHIRSIARLSCARDYLVNEAR